MEENRKTPLPTQSSLSVLSRTSSAPPVKNLSRFNRIFSEESSNLSSCLITQLRDPAHESDFDTDLSDDEGCPVAIDTQEQSEKNLYVQTCSRFGVTPASYFLRHIRSPELEMRDACLGPNGIKALSVPLQVNTYITRLNLTGNWMQAEGVKHVAFMLQENNYITDLNLSFNKLCHEGAKILCRVLYKNVNIRKLDLSGNGFKDSDAPIFARLLENNTSLKVLNLRHNAFHEDGPIVIGDSIANNDTLEVLDLSWNHIRLRGALGIAKGIKANSGLLCINLSMNGVSTRGARALGLAVQENSTLEELDISNNRIDTEGSREIAKALKENRTLRIIRMGLNPISFMGAYGLVEAIQKCEESELELLDLSGILVHQQFMDTAEEIRVKRKFDVIVGKVSTSRELEGDVEEFTDKNPLEILLVFMAEQNLRLVDLFKTLDKDQSMSLTRQEFIDGLKEVKTPMSDAQLDELIDMLDKDGDGEVDLGEIMSINKEHKELKMKAKKQVMEEREMANAKLKTGMRVIQAVTKMQNMVDGNDNTQEPEVETEVKKSEPRD